jgi:hypothetical protein
VWEGRFCLEPKARNTDVRIRAARRGDLRQVRAIERQAQRSFLDSPHPEAARLAPLPLEELRWQLEEGWLFVAADEADQPVAFVGCYVIDGDVFVEEVDVQADYAGQRIGDVPWNAPYYRRLGFHTLPREEWGPELHSRVEEEDEGGLDRRTRVCMVREVDP